MNFAFPNLANLKIEILVIYFSTSQAKKYKFQYNSFFIIISITVFLNMKKIEYYEKDSVSHRNRNTLKYFLKAMLAYRVIAVNCRPQNS